MKGDIEFNGFDISYFITAEHGIQWNKWKNRKKNVESKTLYGRVTSKMSFSWHWTWSKRYTKERMWIKERIRREWLH